ncbi:MAG: nucleotidyltransferase [Bacteroidetes bacterium HGW-Bacteroidetes-21]|jgi:NDP-sugar pyrophosphorylase family protein|nr:MAG: nucleotidyltransferase [Bacteroidetes bacterium HGW-Bacteroidetes-21]
MTRAILFSAGLGTRLRPVTSETPKALVKIDGVPLIEYAIRHCIFYGINDIIINVHHFSEQIIDFVRKKDSFGINIEFSDESDKLLETGGGLKKASWFLLEANTILAYNVDILTDINLSDLITSHKNQAALATLAVRNRKTSRYILFDSGNIMCGWKNMETGETLLKAVPQSRLKLLAFSGIQVLSPQIFKMLDASGDKFSIMDVYLRMCNSSRILGFLHDSSFWMDIGKIEKMNEAEMLLSESNFLKNSFFD